jgi:hypothetical protein
MEVGAVPTKHVAQHLRCCKVLLAVVLWVWTRLNRRFWLGFGCFSCYITVNLAPGRLVQATWYSRLE